MKQFWMVWNVNGGAPRVQHPTEQFAIGEAERLARTHPGETFVVLEAAHVRQCTNMLRVDLRADSKIPF